MLIFIPIVKSILERTGVTTIVGFLLLGFIIRLIDTYFPFITPQLQNSSLFLALLGIATFSFKVGFRNNIRTIVRKLSEVSMMLIGNILVNFALGFLVAHYVLAIALPASLVIAVALTSTSATVSTAIHQKNGIQNTTDRRLLEDVTDLNDFSGLLIMTFLLAIIPLLQTNELVEVSLISTTIALLFGKLILFICLCYLFAHYLESSFTQFNDQWTDHKMGLTIGILGISLAIIAISGYLGFSLALGALFAGLAFSRNPQAINTDTPFKVMYDFFTPFFFIHIGMQIDPTTITKSFGLAVVLVIIAITRKIAGVSLPALRKLPKSSAILLGVSMLPRS